MHFKDAVCISEFLLGASSAFGRGLALFLYRVRQEAIHMIVFLTIFFFFTPIYECGFPRQGNPQEIHENKLF